MVALIMRSLSRFIAAAMLLSLVACQTTAKGSFCQIASPVRLNNEAIDRLSDAEVERLVAHNRRGERLCGWRP